MKDVMIDLETFDNSTTAVICQFGGVYFDRHTGELGSELLVNIDAVSAMRSGSSISAQTVYWWLNQSKKAQESITKEPRYNIVNALNTINTFLKPSRHIWSHATFDFVILINAYLLNNIKPKFHYRDAMDIRTLVDLAGTDIAWDERIGTQHNALDDSKFQVQYCTKLLRRLYVKNT